MVRARTRGAMPAPRIPHRGSHCRIRQSGSGTQILRGKRQEMVILHDSRHLRWNSGCLLLYNPTVIYKHIQMRSRTRPGHCFPLFRPGDQYFINYPNGSHLGQWRWVLPVSVGAITFSIIIGLLMSFIFRKEEKAKKEEQMNITPPPEKRPMWQTSFHFFTMVLILVFANWGAPAASDKGLWFYVFTYKWYITGILALFFCWSLIRILKLPITWVLLSAIATALSAFLANTFITDAKLVPLLPMIIGITSLSVILLFDKRDDENREWAFSSWGFAKQILPLLAIGVVFAGFLLGSTHDDTAIAGIIPNHWIEWAVGGNSLLSNFFASFTGAFMYFATLTEVPIIQGLLASGMGKGPALALLLAGPSLSLPNMLVISGVMGTQKTIVYVALVIIMATVSGYIFGSFF